MTKAATESWNISIIGACDHGGSHRLQRGMFSIGRQVDIGGLFLLGETTTHRPIHQYDSDWEEPTDV